MGSQCTDDFSAIARHLGGFTCRHARAFLHDGGGAVRSSGSAAVLACEKP
jgi:hypothetical protein